MVCRFNCESCGSDIAGRLRVLLSVAAAKLPPRQSLPHRTLSRTKVTFAAGIQVNPTARLTPITTASALQHRVFSQLVTERLTPLSFHPEDRAAIVPTAWFSHLILDPPSAIL